MSLRLLASGGLVALVAAALAACQATPAPGAPDAAATTATSPSDPAMSAEIRTMFVAPETKDCTGVGPTTCLQVAETATGPWTLFYDSIAGFTHEPGYLYELQVSVSQRPTPVPADASSLVYTLVEVVSKTATGDAGAATSGLYSSSWQVTGYNNGQQPVVSLAAGSTISLLFADGKLSGQACNNYNGSYTQDGDKLTISPLATTQMMCPEAGVMEQETAYLAALQAAATWQIDGSVLTLRDAAGAMQVTGQADVITR